MNARPLVCIIHEREGFVGDVCPCYHAAIEEDIRTTWSKIDAPERLEDAPEA